LTDIAERDCPDMAEPTVKHHVTAILKALTATQRVGDQIKEDAFEQNEIAADPSMRRYNAQPPLAPNFSIEMVMKWSIFTQTYQKSVYPVKRSTNNLHIHLIDVHIDQIPILTLKYHIFAILSREPNKPELLLLNGL
jgi:hypothetical protein